MVIFLDLIDIYYSTILLLWLLRILHLFNIANILYLIHVTCDFQYIEILYKVSYIRIMSGDPFYDNERDKIIVEDNEATNYSRGKDRR